MAGSKVLGSAAKSASYNMILQLLFRLLTFVLNAVVLRYISRDTLGTVNVRLTLLYSTILFITREAFRRSCLSKAKEQNWQQVINLLWCTIPLSVVCSLLLGVVWIYALEQPQVPGYSVAVVYFAGSAIIEMLCEPLWVLGQAFLFVRLRVLIEGAALLVRCIVTVLLVIYFPGWGLMSFCYAQVLFTSIYSVSYYLYFVIYIKANTKSEEFHFKSMRQLFPQYLHGKPFISMELASLTWSFFKQSFLKQILTEGERYVMTIFNVLSFADQGIYDIINNIGSLVARFIFLPIEDSGYLFFSQSIRRGISAKVQQSTESFILASQVLEVLLKTVTLIGLIFLAFGYSYSYLLLDIYGGSMLSSGTGPTLLRWYCLYVLIIAINGTTECFVFAAMSKQDVDRFNQKMLGFSFIFLISAWFLTTQIGSVGFVLANCLNMLARILHSIYYIHGYYRDTDKTPLIGILPSLPVSISLLLSWIITALSEIYFCCHSGVIYKAVHVGIGGLCLLIVLGLLIVTEKGLVLFVKDQYRQRYSKSTQADKKTD